MKLPPPQNPGDAGDHNRMIVAVILSLLILMSYEFFFGRMVPQQQAQQATAAAAPATPATAAPQARAEVVAATARVPIRGKRVTGSINLTGARLDDLLLAGQYTAVNGKDLVPLLTPASAPGAFYAESGWVMADKSVGVPGPAAVWSLAPGSAAALESGGSVTLRWDGGQGVVFERTIALDDDFLFTVTQRVVNRTARALTFNPWHLAARTGLPADYTGTYIVHEGPIAYLGGAWEELSYPKAVKGKKIERDGVQGWLGITDKYWMVALLPGPAQTFNAHVAGEGTPRAPHVQADIVGAALTAAPGSAAEDSIRLYAGVKDYAVIKAYEKDYGFKRLDLGMDFGLWYFITKPLYYLLHALARLLGHIAFAILALTVIVRGAMFPLATKAYVSMARMRKVMPQLRELQERHKDDKAKLQMEILELYQREDANPFGGCWPMLLQIPIFFALYKVILLSVEMRHAPFWGWIHDLSAPDPTSVFNLFGLIPWTPPQALQIGAWPLLFCATMIVQKRLSPPVPDPVQEQVQSYFPYFITLMLAHFASGLVIYWTWSNLLAVLQQYYILRKYGGENVSLIRGHHERRKPGKKKGGH